MLATPSASHAGDAIGISCWRRLQFLALATPGAIDLLTSTLASALTSILVNAWG